MRHGREWTMASVGLHENAFWNSGIHARGRSSMRMAGTLPSNILEPHPHRSDPLQGFFDLLRDDDGARPAPGPEDLLAVHLGGIDSHADDRPICPHEMAKH